MPVDPKLLNILCCPATKVPVLALPAEKLSRLNERIQSGAIRFVGGEVVEKAVAEGLITEDAKTIYEVRDGIPIMLVEKGIPASQIGA